MFGGKSVSLYRKRKRVEKIKARIPNPNNITMRIGNKALADAVFADTGLDVFLDDLKRDQGDGVSKETATLVSNSMEMTGISIDRLDQDVG